MGEMSMVNLVTCIISLLWSTKWYFCSANFFRASFMMHMLTLSLEHLPINLHKSTSQGSNLTLVHQLMASQDHRRPVADPGGGATSACTPPPPFFFYWLSFLIPFCIRMLKNKAQVAQESIKTPRALDPALVMWVCAHDPLRPPPPPPHENPAD